MRFLDIQSVGYQRVASGAPKRLFHPFQLPFPPLSNLSMLSAYDTLPLDFFNLLLDSSPHPRVTGSMSICKNLDNPQVEGNMCAKRPETGRSNR